MVEKWVKDLESRLTGLRLFISGDSNSAINFRLYANSVSKVLRCLPFLLLLMSLMTLMMSEPPGFQSSYEKFRKNFVPFDTQKISKQFGENPPWLNLQVFWLLTKVPPRLSQCLLQIVCLKSFLAAF